MYLFTYLKLASRLLLLCLIYSCSNMDKGRVEKGHPSVINLSDNPDSSTYFSVADNIQSLDVMNLETSEKSIISEAWGIERILKINSRFFILDAKYMSVKVFDTSGKFLFNIGKLGKGKGAFVRIEDMQYYFSHNSLLVLCNSPAKLMEFTLDGQLIKETPIQFYATSFAFQSFNSFIFYVNQNKSKESGNKNILITDSCFSIKERMLDMPSTLSTSVKFSGGIFSVNGDVYFNPAFSNIYYLSKKDTLLPTFQVDYGSRKIPAETPEGYLMDNLKNYGFQYNSFIKTKDFVGFNYHSSNIVSSAFYNINSRNIMTTNEKRDSLNLLFSNLMFQKGDTIISVLDLNRLSPFIVRNKENIRHRFPEFLQKIKIKDSNQKPVLLIYKLKSI